MVVNSQDISIPDSDVGVRLRELLARVAAGDQVTITTDGRPVARLLPAEPARDEVKIRKAIEQMREMSKHLSLGGLKIKDLMNEGRR